MNPKKIIIIGLGLFLICLIILCSGCVQTYKIVHSGTITIETRPAPNTIDISPWIDNTRGQLIITPGSSLILGYEPDDVIHSVQHDPGSYFTIPYPDDSDFWGPWTTITPSGLSDSLYSGSGITIMENGNTLILSGTGDTLDLSSGPWELDRPSELTACKHKHRTTFVSGNNRSCHCLDCGIVWEGECH